tara:strand:+ start:154 stop:894 length:741 start_codon:yes stop_codon:yes gene_type:complete
MFVDLLIGLSFLLMSSTATADQACLGFYGQRPGPNLGFNAIQDSAKLERILSNHSAKAHAEAEIEAQRLINDFNGANERVKFMRRSGRHALVGVAWTGYLLASLYVGGITVPALRDAGHVNFLTLHYSNFFEGFGFMGAFHHTVCAGATACMALVSRIQPTLRSKIEGYVRSVHRSISAKKGSLKLAIPKYEIVPSVLTMSLFTAANSYFEIFDHKGDWTDFYVGQTGLILYYVTKAMVASHHKFG